MNNDFGILRRFLAAKEAVDIQEDALVARKHLEVLLAYTEELLEHQNQIESRLLSTETELCHMKSLFDLAQKAQIRAMNMWREETGLDHVWPDHSELVKWLLDKISRLEQTQPASSTSRDGLNPDNKYLVEIQRLTKERDEARSYGSTTHTLNVLCEALDMGGVSALKLAEMLNRPLAELRSAGLQRVANALYDACNGEVYASELENARDIIKSLSKSQVP